MRTTAPGVKKALVAVLLLCSCTSCTGGINAGENGGVAFIVFAGMLVGTLAILWFILGRED